MDCKCFFRNVITSSLDMVFPFSIVLKPPSSAARISRAIFSNIHPPSYQAQVLTLLARAQKRENALDLPKPQSPHPLMQEYPVYQVSIDLIHREPANLRIPAQFQRANQYQSR